MSLILLDELLKVNFQDSSNKIKPLFTIKQTTGLSSVRIEFSRISVFQHSFAIKFGFRKSPKRLKKTKTNRSLNPHIAEIVFVFVFIPLTSTYTPHGQLSTVNCQLSTINSLSPHPSSHFTQYPPVFLLPRRSIFPFFSKTRICLSMVLKGTPVLSEISVALQPAFSLI